MTTKNNLNYSLPLKQISDKQNDLINYYKSFNCNSYIFEQLFFMKNTILNLKNFN